VLTERTLSRVEGVRVSQSLVGRRGLVVMGASAGMPSSAIANVAVDAIASSRELASTIAAMVNRDDPPPPANSGHGDPAPPAGEGSVAVCPECGSVLNERTEAGTLQWQCRVGHRYSPDALIDAQAEDVEGRRQSQAAAERIEIVRPALGRPAATTLRRVEDADETERAGEGAA
jgi:hypothetical protein